MPDDWGDTWNDPGAGVGRDYSGWGNDAPAQGGGWGETIGGWLGAGGGALLGGAALGPLGMIGGGKAGYAAGSAIGGALGGLDFGAMNASNGGLPGMGEDRASDDRGYAPLAAAAKQKVGGPISARVRGMPANFETMSDAEKKALLQQMAQAPNVQSKKGKTFEAKAGGQDVYAIGRNVNNDRLVFADSEGNLFLRKQVARDKNGRDPVEPEPTDPGPQTPGVTPPVVIDAGGNTDAPLNWGYTTNDMADMTRAMGLGHLVDSNYGVEQLYFQQNRPEFALQDTGRYRKLASGGKAPAFAGGGHVKGPGTGTSDSVPAVIDGKYPAALSNNEFVFTERAVKGFGGGDPDRGASALQVLMRFGERLAGGR